MTAQLELFDNLKSASTWERRVVSGFLQFREVTWNGQRSPWHFVIYDFGEDDASVINQHEQQERVPWCDRRRAIQIGGKWYRSRHWKH